MKRTLNIALWCSAGRGRQTSRFWSGVLTGLLIGVCGGLLGGCGRQTAEWPTALIQDAPVFPNYAIEDLVIPVNIAPLNFVVAEDRWAEAEVVKLRAFAGDVAAEGAWATARAADSLQVKIRRQDGFRHVSFPVVEWRRCLEAAAQTAKTHAAASAAQTAGAGASGFVTLDFYDKDGRLLSPSPALLWQVSSDKIDPYLLYRLNAYDDNPCNYLETEERNITNFDKRLLMDNRRVDGQCFNCHATAQNDADCMSIHLRGANGGTLLFTNGMFRKIALPPGFPDLRLSYPAWHPSQKYIAYSSTRIQAFLHANIYKIQDLIVDTLGQLLVYDLERNLLLPAPSDRKAAAEHRARYEVSFPVWSPDGTRLYFCRAEKHRLDSGLSVVQSLSRFRYHIAAVDFDTLTRRFSEPYVVCLDSTCSLSQPAIDSSGRYMVVTKLPLGSYPLLNHGELALIDLSARDENGLCAVQDIPALASKDGEKSHVFGSNGHWMVFGSKRINGSSSAPHIVYFDRDGRFHAPFVLPQERGDFYLRWYRSFLFPVLNRESAKFSIDQWVEATRQPAQPIDMRYFENEYSGHEEVPSGH